MATETSPTSSVPVVGEPPARLATAPKGQTMVSWDEPGDWISNRDGTIDYARFQLGVDELGAATTMLVVKYAPGCHVEPHYHGADYCSIVVEGSIEVTRRTHEVGSMRFVKAGTTYGPLVAGPEGCTVVDIFATGVAEPTRTAMTYHP
ncbi:MAG TPA: hypothetical protein VHS03_00565 [Gaiellaceae bacterium]|jgi:hypothetical protein|nr:hypothetical protein [Gaiellaceae bacterium]